MDTQDFQQRFNALLANIGYVVRGKKTQVALALSCIFSEGHILIEDVPGTGKTTLAKAIAASIDGSMNRIQFTPDLLPSDVTGGMIYNQREAKFEAYRGPIFANLVLADEINRASPKTQAALLEVMEEQQVTLGTETMSVPRPFMVVATQNPVEQEGTYRLPEAQLDRFMMKIELGYPSKEETVHVLRGDALGTRAEDIEPVVTTDDVESMTSFVRSIDVDDAVFSYIVDLVEATRSMPELRLGASPRGAIALTRSAKAVAAAQGRDYVSTDDVRRVAHNVLGHRLLLAPDSELKRIRQQDLIDGILETTQLPAVASAS